MGKKDKPSTKVAAAKRSLKKIKKSSFGGNSKQSAEVGNRNEKIESQVPWSKSKKKRMRKRRRQEAERDATDNSSLSDTIGRVKKGAKIDKYTEKAPKRNSDSSESKDNGTTIHDREVTMNSSIIIRPKSALQSSFLDRLKGSRFRELNEDLYTSSSTSAYKKFQENPELFDQYHEGFRLQVKAWPVNPVDVIIRWLLSFQRKRCQDLLQEKNEFNSDDAQEGTAESIVIADFGCGDAKLAEKLMSLQSNGSTNADDSTSKQDVRNGKKKKRRRKKKSIDSSLCPFFIHSFDLVSNGNALITACDMANVPLEESTVDIGVFSLALMGTNIADFIREAHRVLKPDGVLKIAEVRSRFESTITSDESDTQVDESLLDTFMSVMNQLGFDCTKNDKSNKMFFLMEFEKNGGAPCSKASFTAKPCIYKRR